MIYAVLFVVAVVGFGAAFALALRRGAAAERASRAALRAVAAEQGWQLDLDPSPGTGFRLRGRSADGIDWTLRREASGIAAGEPITDSVVWSTTAVGGVPTLALVVQGRDVHERLRKSAMLGLAGAMMRRTGWGSGEVPVRVLDRDGHEFALRDPALRSRFVVVTSDDALARAALGNGVEGALRRWDPEQVSVWLGPDLQVRFAFGELDRDAVLGLVALGSAIARGCRAELAAEPRAASDRA